MALVNMNHDLFFCEDVMWRCNPPYGASRKPEPLRNSHAHRNMTNAIQTKSASKTLRLSAERALCVKMTCCSFEFHV